MPGESGNDRWASFSAAISSPALPGLYLRYKLNKVMCCSPSRPAVLEAVDGSSPQQQWNLSSSLSSSEMQMYQRPSSLASASEGDDSGTHFSPAASQAAQVADATSDADASSVAAGNTVPPEGLPPLHTAMEDRDYNYNDSDSMSVTSAGTAVMVGHPGSDEEEDTAERRWRLAEQRGNDIRRARAPPCPKAIGPDCFLKVIVVSSSVSLSACYALILHFILLCICTVFQEHKWHHLATIFAALNCVKLHVSICVGVKCMVKSDNTTYGC